MLCSGLGPAHCGLAGTRAGRQAGKGRQQTPTAKPSGLLQRGQDSHQEDPPFCLERTTHSYRQDDPIHLLDCQRTTAFRLRTGHCLLRAHMQSLGLSHTENCPCDTDPQTPEHVLQSCPLHAEARLQHWPIWTTLADKRWGSKDDLGPYARKKNSILILK